MIDNGMRWRIVLTIVLLFLLLGSVAYILFPNEITSLVASKKNNSTNSPTGVYFNSLMRGRVESVSATSFKLIELSDNSDSSKNKEYEIKTTSNTVITRTPVVIEYLVKNKPSSSEESATVHDISQGDGVEVKVIKTDKDNIFTAERIVLSRIPYVLEATVKEASGDSLKVDGVPVLEMNPSMNSKDYKPPTHKTYSLQITNDTEISRQTDSGVKQFSMSDLSEGQKVIVYTTKDVTRYTELSAARVEPVL